MMIMMMMKKKKRRRGLPHLLGVLEEDGAELLGHGHGKRCHNTMCSANLSMRLSRGQHHLIRRDLLMEEEEEGQGW